MSIFGGECGSRENTIDIIRKKDRFYVLHNGWPYDLSPSIIVSMNMPPNMIGVDEVVRRGCDMKGLDGNIKLQLHDEWAPDADAKVEFLKELFDGWVYEISGESLNFKNELVWACPYLKMILDEPPRSMFLSIRSSS